MQLEIFTKALADQTRLRILMLLTGHDALCVCDLTQALGLSQPKISRHLAILRESGLLLDHKSGLWVYYQLHPELPQWVLQCLSALKAGSNKKPFITDLQRFTASNCINGQCGD